MLGRFGHETSSLRSTDSRRAVKLLAAFGYVLRSGNLRRGLAQKHFV